MSSRPVKDEALSVKIANRLYALRAKNKLSISVVVRALQCSSRLPYCWERAMCRPGYECLIGLSRLYHTTTDFILTGEPKDDSLMGGADHNALLVRDRVREAAAAAKVERAVANRAAGGYARAAALSPERRREIARAALAVRWAKHKEGTTP